MKKNTRLRFGCYSRYLNDMFNVRDVSYSLRGTDILSLPRSHTSTYGLHSFKCQAVKHWNSLLDYYRQFLATSNLCLSAKHEIMNFPN